MKPVMKSYNVTKLFNLKYLTMIFKVEKSELTGSEGILFLKSDIGHCHIKESIEDLLKSETFKSSNPELIPIYKEALSMINNNQTGFVYNN